MNFFEVFAERLGYRIYFLGRLLFPYNGGYVIYAAMEKIEEKKFNFTEDEVNSLLLKIR